MLLLAAKLKSFTDSISFCIMKEKRFVVKLTFGKLIFYIIIFSLKVSGQLNQNEQNV